MHFYLIIYMVKNVGIYGSTASALYDRSTMGPIRETLLILVRWTKMVSKIISWGLDGGNIK